MDKKIIFGEHYSYFYDNIFLENVLRQTGYCRF